MTKGITLSALSSSYKSSVDGVWFDLEGTPIQIKVARAGNVGFDKAFRQILKTNRISLLNPKIEIDAIDLQKPAVAEHILKDWKGVVDEKGDPDLYTATKGLKMFNEDEFYTFYKFVLGCSEDSAKFSSEADEKLVGNLKSVSTGS